MKTQCPNCYNFMDIPQEYCNMPIRCLTCTIVFKAMNYEKSWLMKMSYRGGCYLGILWYKTPKAYRFGFLFTFGAISAILFISYIFRKFLLTYLFFAR